MTVSPRSIAASATAAPRRSLLDVAYDVADTPSGRFSSPSPIAGSCRISFDPTRSSDARAARARRSGQRVLRAPRAVDGVRRELDEYFEGRRHDFDLELDLRGLADFTAPVLHELAQRRHTGRTDDLPASSPRVRATRAPPAPSAR